MTKHKAGTKFPINYPAHKILAANKIKKIIKRKLKRIKVAKLALNRKTPVGKYIMSFLKTPR